MSELSKRTSKSTGKAQRSSVSGNKKKAWYLGGIIGFVLVLIGVITYGAGRPGPDAPKTVEIKTSRGPVEIEIYPKLMPVTTGNFEKLVKSNFYDGLTFHRVEGWVIQGGDPEGNGKGGPGWTIPLETNPKLKNVRGAVAMARSDDPNSAGSQFYILKEDASWLDGQYAVFGKAIKGMDVVDQIKQGDKMISVREK